MTDPTTGRPERPIRAPRGTALSCKGWPQEAALRMLMNRRDAPVTSRSVPPADGRIADST